MFYIEKEKFHSFIDVYIFKKKKKTCHFAKFFLIFPEISRILANFPEF